MSKKKITELESFTGSASNFVVVGVDTVAGVTKKANFASLLSSPTDPRIVDLTTDNLEVGCMLFYDLADQAYKVVKPNKIAAVLADYDNTRYETNYDTFVGLVGGKAHFVARDDAYGTGFYASDAAATSCYYRIEIDNTSAGSLTFSAASGNGTVAENTISWSAGETMANIVALFVAKNASYITFAALADGSGVGCEIGGYGANTLTVTTATGCTVTDLSKYAFKLSESSNVAIGDTYIPGHGYAYIDTNTHHNFRGSTARTILGSNLVDASSSCIANTGNDYSYRTGMNFATWKDWATASGDSTFEADGVNGTSNASVGHVMNKTTFNANVNSSAASGSAAALMYEYYNHIFADASGSYADIRNDYESKYGTMSDLYDAYLMSHMVDVSANSGIVNSMRNNGLTQTQYKADVANITYDYTIIPAWPPEYNASLYGDASTEGFAAETYYHPEPGDLALMYRDDILAILNANIAITGGGTALPIGYRGSSADYNANFSWYFSGASGCLNVSYRYYGYFRSRPVLALELV